MKSTDLKSRGYLTLAELIQKLSHEGIFLGRSPIQTVRFYQNSGRIPKPVHAGKIAYYSPETAEKLRSIRVSKRELEFFVNFLTEMTGLQGADLIRSAAKLGLKRLGEVARTMKWMPLVAADEEGWTDTDVHRAWWLLSAFAKLRELIFQGELEAAYWAAVVFADVAADIRHDLEARFRKAKRPS